MTRVLAFLVGALLMSGCLALVHHHTKTPSALSQAPADSVALAPAAPRVTPTVASRSRVISKATARRLDPLAHRYDITAYTHTGYRTASGLWPEYGMVASNLWPLGTRVEIEGLGIFTVQDRVGGGTDVDVFLETRAECMRFGRKHLRVRVVK